jgi:hypothetical protein
MSDAIREAIEALESALDYIDESPCDSDITANQIVAYDRFLKSNASEALVSLKALQHSGEPIAAVRGWFNGDCVVRALDNTLVLPVGMALYAAPQPVVDVNQQLVADKYEKLEPTLEALVELCNNLNMATYDEVIAAEAALERLYLARKALLLAGKGGE